MIRRNPTLIPMSDNDVQDIRDLMEKEKDDKLNDQNMALQMKRMADNPQMTKGDEQMLDTMKKFKEMQETDLAASTAAAMGSSGPAFAS